MAEHHRQRMALILRLRSGGIEPEPELRFDAPRVVVGRAAGCDLQLPDPSVSSRHASLRQRGSDYVVVDEGSDNGTFSGPDRLVRHAPHTLRDGELLRFGRVWVEARLAPSPGTADVGASRELARRLVEHALVEDEAPHGMTVTREVDEGPTSLRLDEPRRPYVIGTKKSADLRLPSAALPAAATVEVRRHGDQLWVTLHGADVDAKLDDRQLRDGERTSWPRGATLTVGKERLTWADPTAQILERLERGPIEVLAKDELFAPPEASAADDPEDEASDPDEPPDTAPSPERSLTENAPALRSRAKSTRSRLWTSGDALVFMLALGVLGLSLWAIRWLASMGPA